MLPIYASMLLGLFPSLAFAAPTQKGHLELSLLDNSGNTESSKYLVDAKLVHKREKSKLSAEAKVVYGTANGEISDRNWKTRLQGDRNLSDRLYVFLSGSVEQNDLKGIETRYIAESGLGYDLIKKEKDRLFLQLSGGYVDERRVDPSEDVQFPTVGARFNYEHQFTEKTRFEQKAKVFDNVEDSKRYFVNEESALTTNLMGQFALKVAYSIAFDSKPPTGFGRIDRSFRSALLYSF